MCYNLSGPTGCVTTLSALTATFLEKRIVMAEDSLPTTRAAAKAMGAKHFVTGIPCKRGHTGKRTTSDGKCVECVNVRSLESFYRNHEQKLAANLRSKDKRRPQIAAYMREYNAVNAERIAEAKAACYQKRKAHYAAVNRANWLKNYDDYRAKRLAWLEQNRERMREHSLKWARGNPSYFLFRARRARQATPPWLSETDRAAMLALYDEARRIADETGIPHEVDHIVPLLGENVCGLHVPWNLQILTRTENRSKGNKHGE
jgi:hypothetical protein